MVVALLLQPQHDRFTACVRDCGAASGTPRGGSMLETIAIILIVLWLLGMVSGYTMGNFI